MNSLLSKREEPDTSMDPVYDMKGRVPGDCGVKQQEDCGCQCTKSKCLKLYCACFAKGKYCGGSCKCQNCHNFKSNKLLRRKIREKNKNILTFKHEAIYEENIDLGSNGSEETPLCCKCSRSGCIKAYCECFARGRYCTDFCKCINCKNRQEFQSTKKQDYMRWKNLMKNNEKNMRKKITNKLEYVFMPAGSLYSLMISKINHQNEHSQDEDCTGLMSKLIETLSAESGKFISTSGNYLARTKPNDLQTYYTSSSQPPKSSSKIINISSPITNIKKFSTEETHLDPTSSFNEAINLGHPITIQNDDSHNTNNINSNKNNGVIVVNKTPSISPPFTPVSVTPQKTIHKKSQNQSINGTINAIEIKNCDVFNSSNAFMFETPKKPKGSNSKFNSASMAYMNTALTTSTSTPNQPKRMSSGGAIISNTEEEKKDLRRAMIVDEWAMYTEAQVKTNIIMNEFFKMVRPKGFVEVRGESPRKILKVEGV